MDAVCAEVDAAPSEYQFFAETFIDDGQISWLPLSAASK
jgi:hypothetical protein